jgi:hypothetical protein
MTDINTTPAVQAVPRARLPDWQLRFADLVAARLSAPFAWGQHDCCLWAADVVQAITGIDPAAHLRGQYTDEKSALRLVRSLGGLESIASAALGAATTARFATVGDVVLITHERITTLAVCNGTSLLAPGAAGLQAVAMPVDCLAWRV